MAGTLTLERDAGIAIIRFDNPPLGFLDGAMTVAFETQLEALLADPALRAVILTGAQDGVFIRHFDLGELAQAAEALALAAPSPNPVEWHDSIFHRLTRRIETCDVPVIAAINGDCMGVGFELALACDIRIAKAGPWSLGMPEMNLAMFPGGGGTVRLARLLPAAEAFELIACARVLDPAEALQRGVINAVSPDPLVAALAMARTMAQRSPSGIAAAKRIIRQARDLSIEQALTLEQREVHARLGGDEVRSALQRYVDTGADLRTLLPANEIGTQS